MTRAVVACLLLGLSGCASERGFRPYEGDDDGVSDDDPSGDTGDGTADDDPDTGGWGDWELGDVPDLAVVLGIIDVEDASVDLVVTDLRGRILDRWEPPPDPETGHRNIVRDIHALGEGEVLVTTTHGLWDKTTQDQHYGNWDVYLGLTGVWHGDLVEQRWTRLVHLDWSTYRYRVDATGEVLPDALLRSQRGLRATPWGTRGDGVLLDFDDGACGTEEGHRILGLDAVGGGDDRLWLPARAWGEAYTAVTTVGGGVDGEGEPAVFARAGTGPCDLAPGTEPELVRWSLDGPVDVLTTQLEPSDQVLGDPRTGAAVVLQRPDATGSPWRLRWLDAPDAVDSAIAHPGTIRPLLVLDPEYSAAVVALTDPDTHEDDIVLMAGGRDVWHIDRLTAGLGQGEPFQLRAGTVISVPGD